MVEKILVTGAAGFIGSHLVDSLVKKKYQVFSLDDLSGGYIENVNSKSTFYPVDLQDGKHIKVLLAYLKPQIIFHLAADATEGRSQFTPVNCTSRNYLSTLNLLASAVGNGLKRFIFTSSMSVYGDQKPPFREDMETKPVDIYGISKASSEKAIEILSKVHGFEYCIIRPHNVYGPRQNMADPYRNVVAIFMNKILKKEPIYIYGDGMQERAFSFIEDSIPIIVKSAYTPFAKNQTFNLGSDTPVTINYLVEELKKITKFKIETKHLPDRPQEVKHAYSSHTKAKKLLNFKDKTNLSVGLSKMWQWAKSVGPVDFKYIENLEIETPLVPETWRNKLI